MTKRIKLALQKKGRLTDACRQIFEKGGFSCKEADRQLVYRIPEAPIDLLFVRDDDIPALVSNGVCDFGIVGLNVFQETKYEKQEDFNAEIFAPLGIAKCRLAIAVPDNKKLNPLSDLNDLKIATTYPAIVKNFLKEKELNSQIVYLSGSVEIAPQLQLSDVIADIVSSGATLKENNLKEVATILDSEAVLINNKNIDDQAKGIANRLITTFAN